MKNILLILISIIAINTIAQKDTIYFNKHWEKVSKEKAKYYRLVPLEKVGDLYRVNDYYINGNPQMEGFWSDVKNEKLEGITKWYFENGTLSEIATYKNGELNGSYKSFTKKGELHTEGVYKNDEMTNGTFKEPCSSCSVSEFKNGKKIAYYKFYKNTNKIAEKEVLNAEQEPIKRLFYDINGNHIGEASVYYPYGKIINGKNVEFDIDNDRQIIGIYSIANYKDGELEGETIIYNPKNGGIVAQGIYKDGKPLNGSFTNYVDSTIKTYKNGVLDGEELFYSDTEKLVAKGINKNGKRWSGQFYDVYYDNHKAIVNYEKGVISGKQVSYYSTNFEKIAVISHIENEKKEGKITTFKKDGKELSKGIYKDDKPWNGSFYPFYYHLLSSYKEGLKHGKYIQYSTKGKIISQQEYENGELGGTIVTTGYFENKTCKCVYRKGEPYKGKVCVENLIRTYKKGIITKLIKYNYDDLKTIEAIVEYKDEKRYKETNFINGKKYVLIHKDGRSYDGVQYNTYTKSYYTFKKSLLEGPFLMTLGYSDIWVSGNYKNNKHHGIINFENKSTSKIATCTYEYGKPINGKVFTELGELNYKNGLKIGKEVVFESVYLYKKGERTLIYNYTEKEYKKGKIEGEVNYFIGDSLVNTNSYKNGKIYNGTFYKDEKFTLKYKNGDLQTVTANPNPYTVTEYYKNNEIAEVRTTKENTKPYIGFYHLGKKYNGIFLNFDNKRFPLSYIMATYKDGVKNGIEKRLDIDDDLKETLINTKTYKNGKLTNKIWHNYYVNNSGNVQGSFKEEKPYNGYFYTIENNAFNIFHFKDGIKEGQQYSGYLKELAFIKTDSISYKKGKPFQGNKATSKYKFKFLQQYEKGEIVKTEILSNYDELKAIVTYSDNGIITKNTSEKIINELVYLDKIKDKAKVILYKDLEKVGTLEYDKDKITKLDLEFREGGLDLKYYINKEHKVTIKAKGIKYSILIYPVFNEGDNFTFIDFLDTENLFMYKHYDAKADFYLDKVKKPICSCTLKNGKPFNGTIIGYYETKKTYNYKKYKEGERVKKERELTKKQLTKALQANK